MSIPKSDVQEVKRILILGMYALKFGYTDSNEIALRKQAAFDYYIGREFELDYDQMRFHATVNSTLFSIINTLEG
jgi:hypothetical protein